jgi:ribosome-associated protein
MVCLRAQIVGPSRELESAAIPGSTDLGIRALGATKLMKEPKRLILAVGERPINLTQVLKLAGCVDSGGAGKALIAAGQVYVNGEIELRKRCQMKVGDTVEIVGGPTIVLT